LELAGPTVVVVEIVGFEAEDNLAGIAGNADMVQEVVQIVVAEALETPGIGLSAGGEMAEWVLDLENVVWLFGRWALLGLPDCLLRTTVGNSYALALADVGVVQST
jgi:hypothetical protein